MFEQSYYLMYNNVCNLINVINRMAYDFYFKNIEKLVNNDKYNSYTKYKLINHILDIRISMIKDIFIYDDSVTNYYHLYNFYYNFSEKLNKMIFFQNIIITYINEKISNLEMFNNNYIVNSPIIDTYSNVKDKEQIQIYENLLKNLEDFKNSQFELFYIKKMENIGNINHDNNFILLLNRYLERLRYAEIEIIVIKYGNYIGIDYPLYEATKNVNNYISECNKYDNIYPII